jgi:putative membrane protein
VLTDKPQKPQIVYKVDTKANPVAGKITSTASNTLIQQVKTEFVPGVEGMFFDLF